MKMTSLFDPSILTPFLPLDLPQGYKLRPLELTDYSKGYLELLSQLTVVGDINESAFKKRFDSMKNTDPLTYYIIVMEDEETGKVVASTTLVLEWKFIHEAGSRGRIEDVVVDQNARGKNLAKYMLDVLVELGRSLNAYKLSLECDPNLEKFYGRVGFKKDGGYFMVQKF